MLLAIYRRQIAECRVATKQTRIVYVKLSLREAFNIM